MKSAAPEGFLIMQNRMNDDINVINVSAQTIRMGREI